MEKMVKITNKIFKIVINFIIFLLSILLILVIYGSIQLNILGKEYIDILGYSFFEVKTGSMEPLINIKDIVIVKIGQDYEKGDIVTYKKDDYLVTHRVMDKKEEVIITKGDNNNTVDDPIESKNIIGKVVYTIGNVAIWQKVFTNNKVITLLITTTIIFIFLITYKEKNGEKNVRKEKDS